MENIEYKKDTPLVKVILRYLATSSFLHNI